MDARGEHNKSRAQYFQKLVDVAALVALDVRLPYLGLTVLVPSLNVTGLVLVVSRP